MSLDSARFRTFLQKEQKLLIELAMILAVALVIGVFFLENINTTVTKQRRDNADALVQLLVQASREHVVTGNLVSLNVVASNAGALKGVDRLEIRDAAGKVLAKAGVDSARLSGRPMSQRAIRLGDGGMAGEVRLWPAVPSQPLSRQLENNFVLIVFCLLLLRILAEMGRRRWLPKETDESRTLPSDDSMEADILPVLSVASSGNAQAFLRISIVNFDRLKGRLTASLVDEILAGYQQRLQQVAAIYGAQLQAPLGEEASLRFAGQSRADASFQALCAGMLFRQLAREWSDERKNRDRTPLEFKQIVSTISNLETSWALCMKGLPGRVHMPEDELMAQELDTRLLFQPERCLVVKAAEHEVRLQPIEQLAQRYHRLVAEQAKQLAAEL